MLPSYPPPQQPTCVWEDCWVLLPHSWLCACASLFLCTIFSFGTQQTKLHTYVRKYHALCKLCTAVVAGVHLYQPTHSLGRDTKYHNVYCIATTMHLKAVYYCHTRRIEVNTTVTFVLFLTANQYIRRSRTSIYIEQNIFHLSIYLYMITVVSGHKSAELHCGGCS